MLASLDHRDVPCAPSIRTCRRIGAIGVRQEIETENPALVEQQPGCGYFCDDCGIKNSAATQAAMKLRSRQSKSKLKQVRLARRERNKRKGKPPFAALRISQLSRLARYRYGQQLITRWRAIYCLSWPIICSIGHATSLRRF